MPGLDPVLATFVSGLLLVSPPTVPGAPAVEPAAVEGAPSEVPVQRPAGLETSPPDSELVDPAPTSEETGAAGRSEAARDSPAVFRAGRIEGIAHDAETTDAAVAGAVVELLCPCLTEPRTTTTDAEGRFAFDELPAGEYTIFVDRGGDVSTTLVALPEGALREAALTVAPPFSTALLEREQRALNRGRAMISVGGVAAVTAVLMFISAGVEAAKPDCRFGPDACENPPRPRLIGALAGMGGVLALGGAALVVVGARRVRRVDARLQLDRNAAALTVSGRF